jgi:hypothetical protein
MKYRRQPEFEIERRALPPRPKRKAEPPPAPAAEITAAIALAAPASPPRRRAAIEGAPRARLGSLDTAARTRA